MYKYILAISLWIALISFTATLIMVFFVILFKADIQYPALIHLGSITMWPFVANIIAAAAVVIFSKKTEKQN